MRTGCDTLHPGYGFLAENPALSRACADRGIAFVGPDPETLALFGDKTRTRERARELGIPVLTGTEGPTDLATARAFLDALGPGGAVMVKALAGGGGRGMRPVTDASTLEATMRLCASEARAAFGDDAVYVEQLLPHARHIEVQVLGDGLGDWAPWCSATATARRSGAVRSSSRSRRRRRCPTTSVPPCTTRRRASSAAYAGLATVEFLVADGQWAAPRGEPAHPGRAHRHRGDDRPRPGRGRPAGGPRRDPRRPRPHRHPRAAGHRAAGAGQHRDRRGRRHGDERGRHARPGSSPRAGAGCASTPTATPGSPSAPATTRCSRR